MSQHPSPSAWWQAAQASLRANGKGALLAGALAAVLVSLGVLAAGPEILSGPHREVGRGVCAGLGAVVWVGAFWLERRRGRHLAVFTPLLVGLALAAVTFESAGFLRATLAGRGEQGWSLYHYYMGSKYYPELGYGELYAAHLAADDADGRRDYGFVRKGRSMATYAETPRARLVKGFDRRATFSDARWAEFRRDLHLLRPLLRPEKWQGALTDLGYHPSPVWTIVGTPIANAVTVRGRGWWWLVNSDLPLHALALVAMLWAFGPRTTAAAVLWVAATPLNSGNFVGAFLRHDWLHSSLIAVALWHRGHHGSAGVALSWGAMTRIFPGLLAVPILVRALWALARGGPSAVAPAHRAFLLALTIACAVLFGASHLTGRGLGTWPEWLSIITKHGELHPATSSRRVGLGRLALHAPSAQDAFASVPGRTPAEKVARTVWPRRAVQLGGLALLLLALVRRRDLDAMILMTFAIFLLVTLSRYHGSLWMLLFFLGAKGPRDPLGWPAALAGGVLLLGVAVFFALPSMSAQYYVLNYEVLALFVALCAGTWVEDRRRAALTPVRAP